MAVIWTELIKLLVCVGAQAGECARTASQRGLGFREEAMHQTYEILGRSWPMLIPAALFVMQQVLTRSWNGSASAALAAHFGGEIVLNRLKFQRCGPLLRLGRKRAVSL